MTKIIITSNIDGDSLEETICDEQIHIFRARNAEESYSKALKIGLNEEHSYENEYGQLVHWIFVGLVDLDEILEDRIEEGIEIANRIFRSDTPSLVVLSKEKLSIFQKDLGSV